MELLKAFRYTPLRACLANDTDLIEVFFDD